MFNSHTERNGNPYILLTGIDVLWCTYKKFDKVSIHIKGARFDFGEKYTFKNNFLGIEI